MRLQKEGWSFKKLQSRGSSLIPENSISVNDADKELTASMMVGVDDMSSEYRQQQVETTDVGICANSIDESLKKLQRNEQSIISHVDNQSNEDSRIDSNDMIERLMSSTKVEHVVENNSEISQNISSTNQTDMNSIAREISLERDNGDVPQVNEVNEQLILDYNNQSVQMDNSCISDSVFHVHNDVLSEVGVSARTSMTDVRSRNSLQDYNNSKTMQPQDVQPQIYDDNNHGKHKVGVSFSSPDVHSHMGNASTSLNINAHLGSKSASTLNSTGYNTLRIASTNTLPTLSRKEHRAIVKEHVPTGSITEQSCSDQENLSGTENNSQTSDFGAFSPRLQSEIETNTNVTVIPSSVISGKSELYDYMELGKPNESQDDSLQNQNIYLWETFNKVQDSGVYNFQKARINLPSNLNIQAWRDNLEDYYDKQIVDYLAFGWPIAFDRSHPLSPTFENHATGQRFISHLDEYISKELKYKALFGPFHHFPFGYGQVSPLMTRPKKDSDKRRVIMDLSWPHGYAVNDGISKSDYIDGSMNIHLPTVDMMVNRIKELGPGCYMYKTDLARAYRQLRTDPLDWPYLGFANRNTLFFDICPPFGLRSSAMMMQRTSNAVVFIHGKHGYLSDAYIDDFSGVEKTKNKASEALTDLQTTFKSLGLEEELSKCCQPSTVMAWLGILLDTIEMSMTIPSPKLKEIRETVLKWMSYDHCSRHQVQCLLGLLNYVANVAPDSRLFTNRILQFLRGMHPTAMIPINEDFRKDVKFFVNLFPEFKGKSLINKEDLQPNEYLELDACLLGCGGLAGDEFYTTAFPPDIVAENHPICHLETLNIVVAFKLWGYKWSGKKVRVYTDNMVTCYLLQTGRSRDPFLLDCAREIFMMTTKYDICMLVCHKPGAELITADALSRAQFSPRFMELITQSQELKNKVQIQVPDKCFRLINRL